MRLPLTPHLSPRAHCPRRADPTRSNRVRLVAVAILLAVATLPLRQFWIGVGADEFSLLRMAEVLRSGEFPYAEYWDVRPPLAYLWGLPSAFIEDAGASVALLRVFAWLAHVAAGWAFFCLFQRELGVWAAGVGTVGLVATANATTLHAVPTPNHFAMAMAVVAFALLVSGIRGRRVAHLLSALLVGALPWVMVHTALASVALAALAMFAGPRRPLWALVALAPSAAVVGTYWLWGPFDALFRTVFAAPFEMLATRNGGDYAFFQTTTLWMVWARAPWAAVWLLVMIAGAAAFPSAWRAADGASALRRAPHLVAPLAAGFAIMVYAKPPAPAEYWVDMAPAVGLMAAVATTRLLNAPLAARLAERVRVSPQGGRAALTVAIGAVVALPVDPWRETPTAVPTGFCREAAPWLKRLRPSDTVLDFTGLCGFAILEKGAVVQPPFTFAPLWWRQFERPWVGGALDGDDGPAAATTRLRRALALGDGSAAPTALVLADNRILAVIRERGLEQDFHRRWRTVWFRRIAGADIPDAATGVDERVITRLAIFARRATDDDASTRFQLGHVVAHRQRIRGILRVALLNSARTAAMARPIP